MTAIAVVNARDNVGTALEPLDVGRRVRAGNHTILAVDPIARGHKIALCAIAAGATVVKYGCPIGVASADIPEGAHVHTHNLASTRGRGDLPIAGASR